MKNILEKWQHLFGKELGDVDSLIIRLSQSPKASLIPTIVSHIISSGGKRIRPILTILSAKLCGYTGSRHIDISASIEFFHTATLLHDDVVDKSDLRRGIDTANNVWGNEASILVGDFLLGKAFQILAQDGSVEILKVLADSSAIITEGEVHQLMAISNIDLSKDEYIDIINAKTAQLFNAACTIGAMLANEQNDNISSQQIKSLSKFGRNLGIAFQIIDDALDYSAQQQKLGKTIGDDFWEGKVTLPIIIAYQLANDDEQKFLKETMSYNADNISIEDKDNDKLLQVIEILEKYKAIDLSFVESKKYAQLATQNLTVFDDSQEKQALIDILEFSINRPY